MEREDFRRVTRERVLVLDGAAGTQLLRLGLPPGVCPEAWALEHARALRELHHSYREAGSDIIYTCTFGANRVKLAEFGLDSEAGRLNRELAGIARAAVGTSCLVFGNLGPTGKLVEPFGELGFEEAVDCYTQQARALLDGGVDGFVIETMLDIQEARAALIAVREICGLPAMVSMTYDAGGRTLTGTDPASAVVTLQALGADAVGCNCSTGPADMVTLVHAMKSHATVPIFAKPNAGMPRMEGGRAIFDMSPEEFASFVPEFARRGANLLGGCCGTGPAYIRRVAAAAARERPLAPMAEAVGAVSSARATVFFGPEQPVVIVGERINPTGKKKLQAELRAGGFELVRRYAMEQAQAGAQLLDINFGLSGIDERATMLRAVSLLSRTVELPLVIDTTSPEVVEAALRLYPGRALVNSISLEPERIERTLPLAARYGAAFILLPITDAGVPATASARMAVVEQVYARARDLGLDKADIVVDGLVMAVSSEAGAARATLDLIEHVARDWGGNTVIGTSNISFGMPQRRWLNTALLAMAIDRGLNLAIANPMQELTMPVKYAADALAGRDRGFRHYTRRLAPAAGAPAATTGGGQSPTQALHDCVLMGEKEKAAASVDRALAAGAEARKLVDDCLIPAITRVGELFDRKEYFLPQLLLAADAMRAAFDHLRPHLENQEAGMGVGRGTPVILATVKGDVHDIGKNLVGLMLRNYGFKVLDLGKDVSARAIVDAAREHNARIVGLSALMTTTMVEMREVIALARAQGLTCRFMVGGAVVDERYARDIGADGYSPDALGAVRLAGELTGGNCMQRDGSAMITQPREA